MKGSDFLTQLKQSEQILKAYDDPEKTQFFSDFEKDANATFSTRSVSNGRSSEIANLSFPEFPEIKPEVLEIFQRLGNRFSELDVLEAHFEDRIRALYSLLFQELLQEEEAMKWISHVQLYNKKLKLQGLVQEESKVAFDLKSNQGWLTLLNLHGRVWETLSFYMVNEESIPNIHEFYQAVLKRQRWSSCSLTLYLLSKTNISSEELVTLSSSPKKKVIPLILPQVFPISTHLFDDTYSATRAPIEMAQTVEATMGLEYPSGIECTLFMLQWGWKPTQSLDYSFLFQIFLYWQMVKERMFDLSIWILKSVFFWYILELEPHLNSKMIPYLSSFLQIQQIGRSVPIAQPTVQPSFVKKKMTQKVRLRLQQLDSLEIEINNLFS